MAGADYESCCLCGRKAFYGEDVVSEGREHGASCSVLCAGCAKTHALVALPMATTAQLLEKLKGDDERERLVAWGALHQLLRPVWVNAPKPEDPAP